VLQARYRLDRVIGRGEMGAVYQATDERLGHLVAVKQVLGRAGRLRAALEREARLLARLRHPALPHVSDHFEEGGDHFLVMEYIPATT
jgi:serine/threonine protein kinase